MDEQPSSGTRNHYEPSGWTRARFDVARLLAEGWVIPEVAAQLRTRADTVRSIVSQTAEALRLGEPGDGKDRKLLVAIEFLRTFGHLKPDAKLCRCPHVHTTE